MTGEIVPFNGQEISLRESASNALERLKDATPLEAKAIADDAASLREILARRGWALDQLHPIALVKIEAERKIGEARASIPRYQIRYQFDWQEAKKLLEQGLPKKEVARRLGTTPIALRYAEKQGFVRKYAIRKRYASPSSGGDDITSFDHALDITSTKGMAWQRLGEIPRDKFDDVVETIKDSGEELTTSRVLYQGRKDSQVGELVEKGIWKLADGRYRIRYKQRGKTKTETLQTTNITTARKTLLERRGLARHSKGTTAVRLDSAYNDLRKCLDKLDRLSTTTAPEVREEISHAIAKGHEMEDSITRGLSLLRGSF